VVVSPSKFDYEPLNLSNIRDTLIRLEESVGLEGGAQKEAGAPWAIDGGLCGG